MPTETDVAVERRQFVIAKPFNETYLCYTGSGTWSDKAREARIWYDFEAARDLASTLPGAGVIPREELVCD